MGGYIVDLDRKILFFLDMPHNELLARLRPLLSHDAKRINLKVTDKSQKHGLKTKNIVLIGYPVVIFCSVGLRIDEQEGSRFWLLSPESTEKKIQEGIHSTIKREANLGEHRKAIGDNAERILLKERVLAIRDEAISDVVINNQEEVETRFLSSVRKLKPRHQRDIKRVIDTIKLFALLNNWWRAREGDVIFANTDDLDAAFNIWERISTCQELNLPPYIYSIYKDVILVAWKQKQKEADEGAGDSKLGLSRKDVLKKFYEVYGRPLDSNQLRQQIIPSLEIAGLIYQENDEKDRRNVLIFVSGGGYSDDGNSVIEGGDANSALLSQINWGNPEEDDWSPV